MQLRWLHQVICGLNWASLEKANYKDPIKSSNRDMKIGFVLGAHLDMSHLRKVRLWNLDDTFLRSASSPIANLLLHPKSCTLALPAQLPHLLTDSIMPVSSWFQLTGKVSSGRRSCVPAPTMFIISRKREAKSKVGESDPHWREDLRWCGLWSWAWGL